MADFTEIKNLSSQPQNDEGGIQRGMTTDGEKAYWIDRGGTGVVQWDPATNIETQLFDNADLVAADPNANNMFPLLDWLGPAPGSLFVTSAYTASGHAMWRYDLASGNITRDTRVDLDPGGGASANASFYRLGRELIFINPAGGTFSSPFEKYRHKFKKTHNGPWYTAPAVSGYPTHVGSVLVGDNLDHRLVSSTSLDSDGDPLLYAEAGSATGNPLSADFPLLLRWTGTSWVVAQTTAMAFGGITSGIGPEHYWTVWPNMSSGGGFESGTFTDDFVATTNPGGLTVRGIKTMNMPFAVGWTAADFVRLDSSNNWVVWCSNLTIGGSEYTNSQAPVMWLADDGEVYYFSQSLATDWRIWQKTDTDPT